MVGLYDIQIANKPPESSISCFIVPLCRTERILLSTTMSACQRSSSNNEPGSYDKLNGTSASLLGQLSNELFQLQEKEKQVTSLIAGTILI